MRYQVITVEIYIQLPVHCNRCSQMDYIDKFCVWYRTQKWPALKNTELKNIAQLPDENDDDGNIDAEIKDEDENGNADNQKVEVNEEIKQTSKAM